MATFQDPIKYQAKHFTISHLLVDFKALGLSNLIKKFLKNFSCNQVTYHKVTLSNLPIQRHHPIKLGYVMTAYPSPVLGEQGDRTLEEQCTEFGTIVIRNDMLIVKCTTHKGTKRSQSRVCVYWLIMVWLVYKEPFETGMSRSWLHICRGFLVNMCLQERSWGKGSDSIEDWLLRDIYTYAHGHQEDQRACGLLSPVGCYPETWSLVYHITHNTCTYILEFQI